jgi:hypothetical protein
MHIAPAISAFSIALLLCGCGQSPTASQQSPPKSAPTAAVPLQVSTEGLPKSVNGRLVLATAPATTDGKLTYEVAIGECVKNECPVLVSLLDGQKLLDQNRTEWASTTREPRPEKLEPGWGVGDLPDAGAGVPAWATGDEEKYVGTAVRVLSLANGVVGLLIDQRTGFEHIKRRHELFAAVNGKVVKVWQAGEGSGPVSTSTAIVKTDVGSEAVVFFEGFAYPSGGRPDTMTATTFAWEAGKIAERRSPVSAAVIGGFATVQAARRFQTQNQACAGWYWVLPASRFEGAGEGPFVLALPSATADRARARSTQASQCAKGKKAAVALMR